MRKLEGLKRFVKNDAVLETFKRIQCTAETEICETFTWVNF